MLWQSNIKPASDGSTLTSWVVFTVILDGPHRRPRTSAGFSDTSAGQHCRSSMSDVKMPPDNVDQRIGLCVAGLTDLSHSVGTVVCCILIGTVAGLGLLLVFIASKYYPKCGNIVYCLLVLCVCVCLFVRLRISPARIKLAASNLAQLFIGVLGRESSVFGNFAPQKPKIGRIGA